MSSRTIAPHHAAAATAALALALTLIGVAHAQQDLPPASGLIMGEVDRCVNGGELPAAQVSVGVQGGSPSLARSDVNGEFFLALPPGQYTIVATADDGTSASRQYVPVEVGQALDIGILDLGGGVMGCGGADSDVPAPAQATSVPTATLVTVPATPTALPTLPPLTPTPAPLPPANSTSAGSG